MLKLGTAGAVAAAMVLATAGQGWAQAAPIPIQPYGLNQHFKIRKKIAIPSYHLNIITANQTTAVGGINARARLGMSLVGLEESTIRKIADEAYEDLRAQFAAKGVALSSPEETAAAVAHIEKLPGNIDVTQIGRTITIGKGTARAYTSVGASKAPALKPWHVIANPQMAMMSQMRPAMSLAPKAVEIDSAFIFPNLTLNFASMSAGTGSGFGAFGGTTRGANVSGNLQFMVEGMNSSISVLSANDRGGGFPGGMYAVKDTPIPGAFATVDTGGAAVRQMATGDSRGDGVVVDVAAWENLARTAYRAYNAGIVAAVLKARG